ncbi:unnamed protein product [Protopolystoma xenopodis]|uniref:Uncharacterized protein n=1 Tax=Protopolystoma xenopodis TaxID=117903 RepID=A0A448X1G7_9PLAT|nr:unnamed protein product [Protopolystoma xenopodis]
MLSCFYQIRQRLKEVVLSRARHKRTRGRRSLDLGHNPTYITHSLLSSSAVATPTCIGSIGSLMPGQPPTKSCTTAISVGGSGNSLEPLNLEVSGQVDETSANSQARMMMMMMMAATGDFGQAGSLISPVQFPVGIATSTAASPTTTSIAASGTTNLTSLSDTTTPTRDHNARWFSGSVNSNTAASIAACTGLSPISLSASVASASPAYPDHLCTLTPHSPPPSPSPCGPSPCMAVLHSLSPGQPCNQHKVFSKPTLLPASTTGVNVGPAGFDRQSRIPAAAKGFGRSNLINCSRSDADGEQVRLVSEISTSESPWSQATAFHAANAGLARSPLRG